MLIETFTGLRCAFQVASGPGGRYSVARIDAAGDIDSQDCVAFTHEVVAVAYARATAALDIYLAAVDATSDAQAEFAAWQEKDEAFEYLSMLYRDAPQAETPVRLH